MRHIEGFAKRSQKDLDSLSKQQKTLFCMVCKLRPKQDIDDWKNFVHHIPCNSWTSCYVGETENIFATRKYQHKYFIKTQKKKHGIRDHMSKNRRVTIHQQLRSLNWNWCFQADEPRKRHGNCRLLERVSFDDHSYIKEGPFQKVPLKTQHQKNPSGQKK